MVFSVHRLPPPPPKQVFLPPQTQLLWLSGWEDPIRTTGKKAWHSVYSISSTVTARIFKYFLKIGRAFEKLYNLPNLINPVSSNNSPNHLIICTKPLNDKKNTRHVIFIISYNSCFLLKDGDVKFVMKNFSFSQGV